MIPELIEVEELFEVVNESYGMFMAGVPTPNGVSFMCAKERGELIKLSKNRYFDISSG